MEEGVLIRTVDQKLFRKKKKLIARWGRLSGTKEYMNENSFFCFTIFTL